MRTGARRTRPRPADPLEVYRLLLARFGPQHWWPGETPFEVTVGAVLTQNTAWKNVEKAIGRLKAAGLLHPEGIAGVSLPKLQSLIRSSGYFRQKSRRLRGLVRAMIRDGGSFDQALRWEQGRLRTWLLAQDGVGPETADSIVLYAAGRPSFVVDAYTRRIAGRLPLALDAEGPYEHIRRYFEETSPRDAAHYNEFHALLVRLAVTHCRKTPDCRGCPLERHCARLGVTESKPAPRGPRR